MPMDRNSWGGLICGLGVVLLVLSFSMDTSISTAYGRINNIGLMNDKQNYVMGSIAVLLIGALMLFLPTDSQGTEALKNRPCPKCAEAIKREAVKCRFCGEDIEPIASSYQSAFAPSEDMVGEMSDSDLNDLAAFYKIEQTATGFKFEDNAFQTLRQAVAHARSTRLNPSETS